MNIIPEHAQIKVMAALTACYRKHFVDYDSIDLDELRDLMSRAIKEAMGDEAFSFWLECVLSERGKQKPGKTCV